MTKVERSFTPAVRSTRAIFPKGPLTARLSHAERQARRRVSC